MATKKKKVREVKTSESPVVDEDEDFDEERKWKILDPEPVPESKSEPEPIPESEPTPVPQPAPVRIDPSLVKKVEPRAVITLREAATYQKHGRLYIKGRVYPAVGEDQIRYYEADGHFLVTRQK